MNWLAHILLSRTHVEYQLGNLLADPLKGRLWEGASEQLVTGMAMHKAIDRFTDQHAMVAASKARLSKARLGKSARLKGVVIDLLYDHFLSNRWDHYASVRRRDFIEAFHEKSASAAARYTGEAKEATEAIEVISRLIAHDWLTDYKPFEGFVASLKRIDARLSARVRAREVTSDYIGIIEDQYTHLQGDFDAFFPQLITFFKSHELGSESDHFLK